jgi:hypothetical protein
MSGEAKAMTAAALRLIHKGVSVMTKEQLEAMTEAEAIKATTGITEHPDNYEGPCACDLCLSYGEPDDE